MLPCLNSLLCLIILCNKNKFLRRRENDICGKSCLITWPHVIHSLWQILIQLFLIWSFVFVLGQTQLAEKYILPDLKSEPLEFMFTGLFIQQQL